MAIQRQFNWLGSQRVDVPHLRLVESAVNGDFQVLSGTLMAGNRALVAWGAVILDAGTVGTPASSLLLRMANAILLHATATEPGTLLSVASTQPDDILNGTNSLVVGSFTPGVHQINYVSLDLVRVSEPTTQDAVVFRSSSTGAEFTQVVPLGRILQYRIHITTSDFDSTPAYCPIAKVTVDTSGIIESIVDCRQMFWRLGSGGTIPDTLAKYAWLNRNEAVSASVFTGGDKDITSQSDFNRATMQRLWELGGGERWYSPADDRSVILTYDNSLIFPTTGENWSWNGSDLLWRGLTYWFANSTATENPITDVTVATPGLTDIVDGEVIYVELDRAANSTIVPVKALRSSLFVTPPTIPGSRHIIAWREHGLVYVGQQNTVVNSGGAHASNTSFGSVKLFSAFVPDPANPVVPVMDADSAIVLANPATQANVVARGITRDVAGILRLGTGANDTSITISKTGAITTVSGLLSVIQGITSTTSIVNGNGVTATGNGTGRGVFGTGGATNGQGVCGQGVGTGSGVAGVGGATNGTGVAGTGGATNGIGVSGAGTGSGTGVVGTGGASNGDGGAFTGGGTSSTGIYCYGQGTESGGHGVGGGVSGTGFTGVGGTPNGKGMKGQGTGTGTGVVGVGGSNNGIGVSGDGTGSGVGVHGTGGITNGKGVVGDGNGTGGGVIGTGGSTNGTGVIGIGGGASGIGVNGYGAGISAGVLGQSGSNGPGVEGIGGTGAAGVSGTGGSTNGTGVSGTGGATNGTGVQGQGVGSGFGVRAISDSGAAFYADSVSGYGAILNANATKANVRIVPTTLVPSSPLEGDIRYDSASHHFFGYTNLGWRQLDN